MAGISLILVPTTFGGSPSILPKNVRSETIFESFGCKPLLRRPTVT